MVSVSRESVFGVQTSTARKNHRSAHTEGRLTTTLTPASVSVERWFGGWPDRSIWAAVMPFRARIIQQNAPQRLASRIRTAKITKYAVRSLPALMTSVIVFAVLDWLGIRPGIDCAAAFAAGAVPNWRLNRDWAWPGVESRGAWARETAVFTGIAVLAWGCSTWATGHTQNWAQAHLRAGDLHRVLLSTASYAAVQAVFFAIKFFDRWVVRSTSTNAA
jgi:putative flippase GtrA